MRGDRLPPCASPNLCRARDQLHRLRLQDAAERETVLVPPMAVDAALLQAIRDAAANWLPGV